MDRNPALTSVLVLALVALAVEPGSAKPPAKATGKAGSVRRELHLRSIDLKRRVALIELAGFSRPPAANLYTFTDERGRRYVAMSAPCDPPFPSGARTCELEIGAGYERHRLIGLEVHLGALHARTVAAPEAEVAAAWEAAQLFKSQLAPEGGAPQSNDGGVSAEGSGRN